MMNVLKGAKLMRDLRTYLELLKNRLPDQFVTVSELVDWKYEITHYVTEMEKNKENAMCCGNGAGLRTLFPTHAKKIGSERIRHAKVVGARYLVTSCPFCKNMLASQSENEVMVLDLPELLMMEEKKDQYDKTD